MFSSRQLLTKQINILSNTSKEIGASCLFFARSCGVLALLLANGLASLDHEGLRPSWIHQISTISDGHNYQCRHVDGSAYWRCISAVGKFSAFSAYFKISQRQNQRDFYCFLLLFCCFFVAFYCFLLLFSKLAPLALFLQRENVFTAWTAWKYTQRQRKKLSK